MNTTDYDDDGFVYIPKWMYRLDLTLSEIAAYGIIYVFSQEKQGCYFGSLEYLARYCKVSRRHAIRILQKLEDDGLIIRESHPGSTTHFYAVDKRTAQKLHLCQNVTGANMSPHPCNNVTPTRDIMSPNNTSYNKEDNKDTLSLPRVREEKVLYGDCVLLTEKEHAALVRDYGEADTARLIEILDLYLANKTKDPYKSHYAAIRKWCVRDLAEQKTAEQRLKNAQEAGQRVNAQQQKPQGPPPGNYAALADANRRFKEITDKYKN